MALQKLAHRAQQPTAELPAELRGALAAVDAPSTEALELVTLSRRRAIATSATTASSTIPSCTSCSTTTSASTARSSGLLARWRAGSQPSRTA